MTGTGQTCALVDRRRARPMQEMDPAARYRHEQRLAGVGKGPPKPIRRRRTDCKEIDWSGFALKEAARTLLGRPCRRWASIIPGQEPSSFRSPRQQLNLAARGVLQHAR